MITNKTRKKVLVNKSRMCESEWCKAKGLMFSRKIIDEGLVFVFDNPRKVGLHMFFVFFPIDVIFLDERKKVVDIKENFRPFTLYKPNQRVKYILELPEDTIKRSDTEEGDMITF